MKKYGLWAPPRIPGVEGHRFALVEEPDAYADDASLGSEILRLQSENPGENIFVAVWLNHSAVLVGGRAYFGFDWWPKGIATPTDPTVCFRYTNGLENPQSKQPLNYAQHRRRSLGSKTS